MAAKPPTSAAYVGLVQATAGAMGGLFAAFTLMPLEVVKTRIAISEAESSSMLGVGQEILASAGVPGLFAGVGPKCAETGTRNFIYFYMYEALSTAVKNNIGKAGTRGKLLLGYIAGVGTIVSTMPLEVLSTQMQSEEAVGMSPMAVTRKLIEKEGIAGLFRGFWFNILLCINPAIQNTCFDYMKAVVLSLRRRANPGKRAVLTALQAFLLGAIAKAIATVITFPLVRVKTVLQCAPADDRPPAADVAADDHPATAQLEEKQKMRKKKKQEQPQSSLACQSWPARLGQLYKGLNSALWKSVLQAALLYMTKDQVEKVVVRIFKICALTMRRVDGTLKLYSTSGRPLL